MRCLCCAKIYINKPKRDRTRTQKKSRDVRQRWYHWTAEINGTTNTMTTDKPYRNFCFIFFSAHFHIVAEFISFRECCAFFWCFWSIAYSLENNEWTNVLPLNCVWPTMKWIEMFIWFILFVFFPLENEYKSTFWNKSKRTA